jgi:cell pole-organizing protein PopZ
VSDKIYEDNQEDAKLEDILKSIRGVIDSHHNSSADSEKQVDQSEPKSESENSKNDESENILELTSIVNQENSDDQLISENVKKNTEAEIDKFTTALKKGSYSDKNQSLELFVNNLLKPLIKDWLNNNLTQIVEKIVSEEIKKIIPK